MGLNDKIVEKTKIKENETKYYKYSVFLQLVQKNDILCRRC